MLLLSEPSLGTIDLDDHAAYVTEAVQLPMPEVRGVVDPRTDADGTYDQTLHIGARAVTATVVAFADDNTSLERRIDAIRRYLHPSLRPTLAWTPVGSDIERRMVVRAESHDLTIDDPRWARTAISWVAPSGLMESSELNTATIEAAGGAAESGRTYNLVHDRTYPASSGGGGETIVTNAGSAPAAWVARLYGPCLGPKLVNHTLGQYIELADLDVAAGQYVELNSTRHSALLNSDPTLSVYGSISLASTWWPLVPGDNLLTFEPETASPGAVAVIEWRDTWL